MTFYKIALLIIFQSSLMMAEDLLDFKEYQIELIIFKHSNTYTDEVFSNVFSPPKEKILNFYDPGLKINKKSFDVKVKKNFFSDLFKNIKPINRGSKLNNEDDTYVKTPNPKSWYRYNTNLKTLAKLNNQLLNNSNYKVLDSFSWIQNIEDKGNANYLHHEEFKKRYGFFLKFYRSRFLHLNLKAYLGVIGLSESSEAKLHINRYDKKLLSLSSNHNNIDDIAINLNNSNEFIDVIKDIKAPNNKMPISEDIKLFINEDQRIFNNEIYYFDHPYFGVVVAIKEI